MSQQDKTNKESELQVLVSNPDKQAPKYRTNTNDLESFKTFLIQTTSIMRSSRQKMRENYSILLGQK